MRLIHLQTYTHPFPFSPNPPPTHPPSFPPSVHRIKAVLLDWLPRRLDPLAFYYWKRPLHNLLALWVLSHACLYPAQWLLVMALLVTLVLIRHMAIQVG